MTTLLPVADVRLAERRELAEAFLPRLGLRLTPEFMAVLLPRPKEKLFFGGVRSGKSTEPAAEVLLEILMVLGDPENTRRYLYWFVMPSYTTVPEEMRYLYEWLAALGVGPHLQRPEGGSWRITLAGGRITIETRTAENPEGLASVACDGVVLVEAGQQSESIRMHVWGRVIEKRGWISYTGTLEDSTKKAGWLWYEQLGAKWMEDPSDDHMAFSLPSWSNSVVFPGGRTDPEILKIEAELAEYPGAFERYVAGVPAGVSDQIYRWLMAGEWGWQENKLSSPMLSRGAGGHDFGEGWHDDKRGHPSTLAAVQVMGSSSGMDDIAVVREVWEGYTGDTMMIESRRRLMGQRWGISNRRWGFDPMQREAAKLVGAQIAPEALRRDRVGMVEARMLNNRLKFDMYVLEGDSAAERERKAGVRRCFEQMKRVHWVRREVKGQGYRYDYARVDDDMAAAVEDAIAVIDTKRSFPSGVKLPGQQVTWGSR